MKKIQNAKFKMQSRNLKFKIFSFFIFHFSFFIFTSFVLAKDITILYTGETHAMLYRCNCPIEPDGGVARRASLIKELRKNDPNVLLLDSGGFFAGGLMDENTQNAQMDMQRTQINLKAIDLMRYDALAVGDDEFNFGRDFLEQNIAKTNIKLLSCNLNSDKVAPYLIKEFEDLRVGIIGVTNILAGQKADGLKIIDPKTAVKNAVGQLKKKNADIIVLLSHLGESEDLKLINDIPGIDIVIVGHARVKEEPFVKTGSTLILRPSWQGRKLGKLVLKVDNNKKIAGYNAEELRLSDKLSDDPQILSILPRCFSDANCKNKDLVGTCQNPGTLEAKCQFTEALRVNLSVITSEDCVVCETEKAVNYLKSQFPGLVVSYLNYPDAKTKKMIKDFGIKALPVYLLGKEAEKEKIFDTLKENVEAKGDYYMLRPQFSGFSYLVDRQKVKSKLDLFISLYDKETFELLTAVKDFNPTLHFLVVQKDQGFEAAKGGVEVEDYLRAACIQKYYPKSFWDYIICRAKNANSSWWEDCAQSLDTQKIMTCARSQEAADLLRSNISLNKELQIMFGPTYLLNNQEIFGSKGVPTKEEFKKILQLEK